MKLNYKKIFMTMLVSVFVVVTKFYDVYAINIMDATSELNNKYRVGHTIPIKVCVQADDEDLKGRLNLNILEKKYTHNINISKESNKEYIFSVPITQLIKEFEVNIESNNKILYKKKFPINILNDRTCCIGILSDNCKQYNFLSDIKIEPLYINHGECIDLGNKEINISLLNCLDFIFLDDFDSNKLSDISSDNLDKWIRNGGVIFLGKGKYAHKNLKGAFENIKDVTCVGNGSIVPIDFEINKNNIKQLQQVILSNINNQVLNKLSKNINLKNNVLNIEKLKNVANGMLKLNNNIIYFLISVLVIYIVGTIIISYIKKSNMFWWTNIICIFSLVLFCVYSIEGVGKVKITTACINEYYQGGYNTDSLLNVYPTKKSTKLHLNNSTSVCSVGDSNCTIDTINKTVNYNQIKEINYLYNNSINNIDNEFSNKIIVENNHLNGEIKNELSCDLKDCFLIVGNNFIKLGNLKKGETLKLDYILDNNLSCTGDYEYENEIQKELSDKGLRQLLKYYLNMNNYQKFNCKLVGFSKRKISKKINDKDTKLNSMNIEIMPVKVKFISKEIKIPSGFIKPIVKESINDNKINREYTFKKDENIYIYYTLPKYANIKKIELTDSFKDGQFVVERFDYKSNMWSMINNHIMKNVDDLNTNKLLVLRIKGKGRVLIPDISVEGIMN